MSDMKIHFKSVESFSHMNVFVLVAEASFLYSVC